MTRPDKRAARFGDRYRYRKAFNTDLPAGFNLARFTKNLREALPAIRRMTGVFRQVADNMRRAREFEATARQVEAVINRRPDILDRIDETLTSYDATSQPGDRPWPYESF